MVAVLVKINAALMCPMKLGVKVTVNWTLWPAVSVTGRFKLLVKFESVRVSFEMVKLPVPAFVNVTGWFAV